MVRNVSGIMLTVIIALACGDSSPAHVSAANGKNKPEAAFRPFSIAADPQAATNFTSLAPEADRMLAAHYAQSGYQTLSRVFGGPMNPPNPKTQWLCPPEDDQAQELDTTISKIAERQFSGEYSLAAQEAEEALKTYPDSCRLMVEWSAAVLMQASVDASSVDVIRQERAVRALITGATEVIVNPEGYSGSAQTLYLVAQFFGSRQPCRRRRVLTLAREQIKTDFESTNSKPVRESLLELQKTVDAELEKAICNP